MAIKGKGKARSGRRVIAAPPRPQLVVRKPPIWRRRWVWATVGGLAAAGILIGVLLALHSSHQKAFRKKEATAIDKVARQMVARFPADRQESPGNFFVFYPSTTTSLDDLSSGKLKPQDATTKAAAMTASAAAAQRGLAQVAISQLIPQNFTATPTRGVGGPGATRQTVLDGQFLMQQAFQLYQRVGDAMKAAAAATSTDQRKALVAEAKNLFTQAGAVFDQGFRKILNVADTLGSPLQLTSATPSPSPAPSAPPIPTNQPSPPPQPPSPAASASP